MRPGPAGMRQVDNIGTAATYTATTTSAGLFRFEDVALGNYVVTLDDLQQSFMRLLDAYQHPSNSTTLAGLAELTGKLNADAVAVRQALVKAR